MKDVTKSADWPANYPSFIDHDAGSAPLDEPGGRNATSRSADDIDPGTFPNPADTWPIRIARSVHRAADIRLLLVILFLGGPLLALCVLLGR